MPMISTFGAGSARAFGMNAASPPGAPLVLKSDFGTAWTSSSLNWELLQGTFTIGTSNSGYVKTMTSASGSQYGNVAIALDFLDKSNGVALATDGFWMKWRCNYANGAAGGGFRMAIGITFDKQTLATSLSSGPLTGSNAYINSRQAAARIRTDRPGNYGGNAYPYLEDYPYTIPPGWVIDNAIGTRSDGLTEYHAQYVNFNTGVSEVWYSANNSSWTKSHSVTYGATAMADVKSIYFTGFLRDFSVDDFSVELLDGEDVS